MMSIMCNGAEQFFYIVSGIAIGLIALFIVVFLVMLIRFFLRLYGLIASFNQRIDEMLEQVRDMGEDIKDKIESLSIVGILAESLSFFRQAFKKNKKQSKSKKKGE